MTDDRLRMAGAVGGVVALFVVFTAAAWLGWGLWSGLAFLVAVVVGVSTPPLAFLLFREGVPNIVAVGLAIAAQVAFGKGVLVRREDGQYEWTVLREDESGRYALVDSGRRVPVEADDGELYAFGFGQLAVVEEHGDNLDPFTTAEPAGGDSDTPIETRAGVDVLPPERTERRSILVSLAAIQRRVRGSASSMLVRRGRDKALDEEGGQGQLSELWTAAFATVLLIVGFGMTAGVLLI